MERVPYIRSRLLFGLAVFLLLFMPYSTFILQAARFSLESHGVHLGNSLTVLTVAWKETILAVLGCSVLGYLARYRRLPFHLRAMDWLLLLFLAYGVIVGGATVRSAKSVIFGIRYDFAVFLFYWAARFFEADRSRIMRLLRWICLAAVPVALFGLAQAFVLPSNFMERFGYSWGMRVTGNPLPPVHYIGGNLIRAMATFPGPNSLAMYLGFVLIAAAFFGAGWWKPAWRWAFLAVVGVAFLVTYSRGHLASLAAAAGMFGLLRIAWVKARPRRMQAASIAFFLVVIAASLWASLLTVSPAKQGTWQALLFHDTSSSLHRDVRLVAWDSIRQHPLGTGLGTSGLATTNTGGTVFNPESWYIQITQELGWPGLVLALAAIGGVYAWLVRMYHTAPDPKDQRLTLFFIISFTAVAVSAQFLPSWFEVASITWWVLCGLFMSDFDRSFGAAVPRG